MSHTDSRLTPAGWLLFAERIEARTAQAEAARQMGLLRGQSRSGGIGGALRARQAFRVGPAGRTGLLHAQLRRSRSGSVGGGAAPSGTRCVRLCAPGCPDDFLEELDMRQLQRSQRLVISPCIRGSHHSRGCWMSQPASHSSVDRCRPVPPAQRWGDTLRRTVRAPTPSACLPSLSQSEQEH